MGLFSRSFGKGYASSRNINVITLINSLRHDELIAQQMCLVKLVLDNPYEFTLD